MKKIGRYVTEPGFEAYCQRILVGNTIIVCSGAKLDSTTRYGKYLTFG